MCAQGKWEGTLKPSFDEHFTDKICAPLKEKICKGADKIEAKIPADVKTYYDQMKTSLCSSTTLVDEGEGNANLDLLLKIATPLIEKKIPIIAKELGGHADCTSLKLKAEDLIDKSMNGRLKALKVRACLVLAHYVPHDRPVMSVLLWLWW